jgi:alkylation response protein AidB-like acyl-CoA dehydrogenase
VDFELSEEQEMLRDVSRSMLGAHATSGLVRDVAEAGADLDDKLWQRGAELGWLGMAVPEDQDGAGTGLVELCLVAEEIGRAVAPGPFVDTALAALAAARGGAPAELVSGLASGGLRASVVHRSSPTLSQAAGSVDWLLVLDDEEASLVEASSVTARRRTTLDRSRGWWDVDLATSTPTHVVATGDDARWLVDAATVLVAADLLGVGEWLLATTVSYAKVREQFGRPIGSFQVVKHKAADMLAALKGVRAATYYAAMALDARTADASLAASVAKAFASEQVPAVAGEALQTHGGIGFTWEHDLHLYLRRAKVDAVVLGNAGFHHERVASLLR